MGQENGIGPLRLNFIRETTNNVTPDDPDWLLFSDEFDSLGFSPNANIFNRTKAGSPDVVGFELGAEDHTATVTYSLQRAISSASDPLADGLFRNTDGTYKSRHSVLARQAFVGGGADSNGFRLFTYGFGGVIETAELKGEPGSGDPVKVTLSYRFGKLRSYKVAIPSGAGTLSVVSTNAGDTTQSITVEDEDAGTSETVALNGTTPATGSSSFTDIDAFWLDADCIGDVTISIGGTAMVTILGSASHGGIEGDRGIPLLAGGSYEAALGTSFQNMLATNATKGGSPFATNLLMLGVRVANSLQVDAVTGTKVKAIAIGDRSITCTATIYSEASSHDDFVNNLKRTQGNIVWTMTAATLTLASAALTTLGDRTHQKGNAVMRRDNTFTATGISVASN